jgi:lactoylglutathione lyase
MAAALRCEIFPADLDATVAFYVSVLGFELVRDERDQPSAYVALARDAVQVGAAAQDLVDRPWGLRDFRLLDPSGYYWRITGRAPHPQ